MLCDAIAEMEKAQEQHEREARRESGGSDVIRARR